jgi:hypothetical protein
VTAARVSDAQIVRFVRDHPDATARLVAERFYTVRGQLQAGLRLKRMVRAGLLHERFYNNGWKYAAPGAVSDEVCAVDPHAAERPPEAIRATETP